jgi:H+-translocating NAD(P) transhydrogenase subunit beta
MNALIENFSTLTYLFAAALFILALKWLSAPHTARRGNIAGEIGMLAAIIGTLIGHHVVRYEWIIAGFVIGGLIGAPMAIWMPMTAVPQRTALSHAFGALAAALVGTAHYYLFFKPISHPPETLTMVFLCLEVLLGSLTFTGSLMAFGKLQEILPTRPMVYKGQNFINFAILAAAGISAVTVILHPEWTWLFPIVLGLC